MVDGEWCGLLGVGWEDRGWCVRYDVLYFFADFLHIV